MAAGNPRCTGLGGRLRRLTRKNDLFEGGLMLGSKRRPLQDGRGCLHLFTGIAASASTLIGLIRARWPSGRGLSAAVAAGTAGSTEAANNGSVPLLRSCLCFPDVPELSASCDFVSITAGNEVVCASAGSTGVAVVGGNGDITALAGNGDANLPGVVGCGYLTSDKCSAAAQAGNGMGTTNAGKGFAIASAGIDSFSVFRSFLFVLGNPKVLAGDDF